MGECYGLGSDGDERAAGPGLLASGVERRRRRVRTRVLHTALSRERSRPDPGWPRPRRDGVQGVLPGFRTEVIGLIDFGDVVVSRVVFRGTYAGGWVGVDSTGATTEVSGVDVFQFKDGLVFEHWHEADHELMWEQLGVSLRRASEDDGSNALICCDAVRCQPRSASSRRPALRPGRPLTEPPGWAVLPVR